MTCEALPPKQWKTSVLTESFSIAHVNDPLKATHSPCADLPQQYSQPLATFHGLFPACNNHNLQAAQLQNFGQFRSGIDLAQDSPYRLNYLATIAPLFSNTLSDNMQRAVLHGLSQNYSTTYSAENQPDPMSYGTENHNYYAYMPTSGTPAPRAFQNYGTPSVMPADYTSSPSYSPQGYYPQSYSPQNDYTELDEEQMSTIEDISAVDLGAEETRRDDMSEISKDEPYAQLIYRALLGAPNHAMVLKDIYEWFEKNTDKPKSGSSKGWQNSIRHNLSMNQGFQKIDHSHPQEDGKKGYIWVLSNEAVTQGGVESTTRFRKNGAVVPVRKNFRSYSRGPLAMQEYSGVRKTSARRSTRSKQVGPLVVANNDGHYHRHGPELTPDPDANDHPANLKVEPGTHVHQHGGIADPFAVYPTPGQYPPSHMQMPQYHNFAFIEYHNGNQYVPDSPPSTIDSPLAPSTANYVYPQLGGMDGDALYNEQGPPYQEELTLTDRTNCEPGAHSLHCDGPSCPV